MEKGTLLRDRGIDRVKAAAIFCVVVIHCGYYADPVGSPDWAGALFWGALVRGAVPLFLMCSGALLLPPERELPFRRLLKRNLLRLLIAMWAWALVYKLWHLVGAGWSAAGVWQAVKEVLVFDQEFHFYYIHMMLLVYLFLPVTRLLVRAADDKTLRYALGLWFALGILYPTLLPYWPFSLLRGFPLEYQINMTYACIGYGLLGWYLRRHPLRRGLSAALFLAGFALTFGGTWFFSSRHLALDERWLQGMRVPVCLMAAGGFCLLAGAGGGARLDRVTEFISRGSFCVYLCHVLFLYAFARIGLTAELLPRAVSIPLLAAAVFVCSLAVYAVLRRIPLVNRWLI